MLLVDKTDIKDNYNDANIVVTALEEDLPNISPLLRGFDDAGLFYTTLVKSNHFENDYWYWRTGEEILKKATHLILILSPRFFKESNKERCEAFWYEVGLVEARGQHVMPFVIDIQKELWDSHLHKTPIRQKQATDDCEKLISTIEQSLSLRKKFFTDKSISRYGNARVFYSKLSVILNIEESLVEEMYRRLCALNDDEIKTQNDVLMLLHKEINFGIKLYKFGKECLTEHPYYTSYREEGLVLNYDCLSMKSQNRFILLSQEANNGYFPIRIDLLIPNHEILGVSFKPFMEVQKNSVIMKNDLLDLIRRENEESSDIMDPVFENTPKTNRVYFNLFFGDELLLVNCSDSNLGKRCNYIYAK